MWITALIQFHSCILTKSTQEYTLHRNIHYNYITHTNSNILQRNMILHKDKFITYEKPSVEDYDPLRMELDNFVNSILKIEKPIVSGYDARDALDVVIKINNMILEDIK